jgi:large subunit ribosomal protein L17
MRHQKKGKKFGRKTGQRKAFVKGLISNFLQKEKITTTETRAKMLKQEAEKVITLAKKQNVASLRLLLSRLPKKAAQKAYYEIAPRYAERRGGYVRVVKQSKRRLGDRAKTATVELV